MNETIGPRCDQGDCFIRRQEDGFPLAEAEVSSALMIAPIVFLSGLAHGDDSPLRTYFVGNSVTDTIRYGSLAKLAKSQGHTLTWGRDMIPGSPLSWLWEHPKDGFQQEPFGLYPRALSEYAWDVLSLQPFDRHLDGKDGDLAMAGNFIDLALSAVLMSRSTFTHAGQERTRRRMGRSSSTTKRSGSGSTPVEWDGTEETRDYFERVVAGLRKAYEGKAKPVLMVPVGDVLLELNQRMRLGKVAGVHRHRRGIRGWYPLQQRRLLHRRHNLLCHAFPG